MDLRTSMEIVLESLSQLYKNFEDYIMTFSTQASSDCSHLNMEFTYWSYDLIDKDLDMDERQYTEMCAHFRKWLKTVIKLAVIEHGIEVTVQENAAIFRNKMEFSTRTHYSKMINAQDSSQPMIRVVTETREKST